jgi:hypothetical protein
MRTRQPLGVKKSDDFRDQIRRATELIVAIYSDPRFGAGKDIRAKVREAIREALEGDEPWRHVMPVQDQDGVVREEDLTTLARVYRQVFNHHDFDRTDLRAQESLFALVASDLDDLLSADGGSTQSASLS